MVLLVTLKLRNTIWRLLTHNREYLNSSILHPVILFYFYLSFFIPNSTISYKQQRCIYMMEVV